MSVLFGPQPIGHILDKSFRFLPKLLSRQVLLLCLVFSIFQAALESINLILERYDLFWPHVVAEVAASIFGILIFYYFQVVYALLAKNAWYGEPADLDKARSIATLGMIARIFWLGVIIAIRTALWSLLLVIPGVIYAMNRLLSLLDIVLRGATISESLSESRHLMTHHPTIPWYSVRTPIMRASGMLLITMAVSFPPGLIIGGTIAAHETNDLAGVAVDLATLGLLFFSYMLTYITMLFSTIAIVGFYLDLRSRVYGIDIRALLTEQESPHAA